jgi:hypothetical protein
VLVQHVDSAPIGDLASFLQTGTTRRVVLATAGARPAAGSVLLAAAAELDAASRIVALDDVAAAISRAALDPKLF